MKILMFLFWGIAMFSCKKAETYEKHDLSSFPVEVCEMKSLKFLYLGPQNYTVYPPLSVLIEGENHFHQIPDCICELRNLKKLDLTSTSISELPNCMRELKNLEFLNLSLNNKLNIEKTIPLLMEMKSLNQLIISGTNYNPADTIKLKSINPNLEIYVAY
ncbi:MAG: hypothetical protein H6581_03005 [Bacteroidia bacterium]|nr:hypothetical protein [Bacteroidia bacterium]